MAVGRLARIHPALAPRWLWTRPPFCRRPRARRITTGLVLTLSAIRSDVTGPGRFRSTSAIQDRMWTATVSWLFALMRDLQPRHRGLPRSAERHLSFDGLPPCTHASVVRTPDPPEMR